jgi:hypothetical protein
VADLVLVEARSGDAVEGETDAAFHGFVHYRDLGPDRSIDKATAEHRLKCTGSTGRSRAAQWLEWSSRNDWPARALAWDNRLDIVKRDAMEEEVADVGRRQAHLAMEAMTALAAPALAAAQLLREDPSVVEELKSTGVVALLAFVEHTAKLLPALAKMEREARGLETLESDQQPRVLTVELVVSQDPEWKG